MQNEIILLIILLALSAFFSGSETALFSVSKLKAMHLLEKKRRGAKVLKKLKDDPHRMLIAILICNNLVNVSASAIATKIAIDIFDNYAIGIATGVMTFLLLVFGEITPKSLATQKYETIALFVARPIRFLSIVLYPIIILFDAFIHLLNIIFRLKRKKPIVTEEELKSYVKAGREAGSIKEVEKEMIHNIFKFDEVNVEAIMTPRPDMAVISSKLKVKDVLNIVKKSPYSRFPVYETNKDHIVGIIHIKEIYKYFGSKNLMDTAITKLMRKPLFVPETKKIDTLLKQFQKIKEHMAIVVDEYGVVSGLVTIEDILEEIVGEIVDETDRISPTIRRLTKNSWQMMGKADLGDVNEKLKTNLRGGDIETLGGYIFTKIGKIPKENDELELDKKYKAIIQDISGNRIYSVKVIRK